MSHTAKTREKNVDMINGSIAGGMLLLGAPLMLSNVLQVLFNMSDIAVVGRFAGNGALGSVGSTSILVTLFTGMLIGLGCGINVAVAQCIGAGRRDETSKCVTTCAFSALVFGLIMTAFANAIITPVLALLSTKPEFMDGAVLYLRIYSFGFPALAVYNFGNAVFSAGGDTKKPLAVLTVSGIINVLLNLFFVIVCDMSVDGVAYASIISQYISAAVVVMLLVRSRTVYRLELKKSNLSSRYIGRVSALGLPAAIQNSIFAIANLFIQMSINSFDSVMVEGNSAAANADALVYDIMAAFYTAGASFIGQNFGARKRKRILKSYLLSIAYPFGAAAIIGVLLVLFGRQFLAIFTPDPAVVDAGMQKLMIMSFSYAISAFMDATIAASRGIGKSLMPTVIVVAGSCVFRIIWIYTVFAAFRTVPSLYLLYPVSWTLTAAAEIAYFMRAYRKLTRSFDECKQPLLSERSGRKSDISA